jgi:hypothetical protein
MEMYKLNITRFTPLAVGCALFLGAAQSAMAQSTASANANGGAQIVTAITISKNQDLLFGQIVSDPTGGTVTVTPAGVRTASENTLLGQSGSVHATVQAASFAITGMPGYLYTVTLPTIDITNPVTITSGAGGTGLTMTLDTFTSATLSGTTTLSSGGTDTLTVGANLNVGANQLTGYYTGSFSVTVAYQ